MSSFESIFQNTFWVASQHESKLWKAFWVVSWFGWKPWKLFESWADWIRNYGKPFESGVDLNQIPGNNFEPWVDLNQFLKTIVSHELSQNQIFLKLSWTKSNKFESYPYLRVTYRKETTSHSPAKSSGAGWAKSSGTLIDIRWSQEVIQAGLCKKAVMCSVSAPPPRKRQSLRSAKVSDLGWPSKVQHTMWGVRCDHLLI